jgi:hypothetical protein
MTAVGSSTSTSETERCSRTHLGDRARNSRTGPRRGDRLLPRGDRELSHTRPDGSRRRGSAVAGDGDLEGRADLTHPLVPQSAEALDERRERHALD